MFTKNQLYKLIIPLIIEQTLAVLVGMVDIVMVSSVGEAAVSGVSLVDTLNILLICLFSALATGGSVVAAQYIGYGDLKRACKAGNQLLLVAMTVAVLIMGLSLWGNVFILKTIFGNVQPAVMESAKTYFFFTALSFPFLGIYNALAALFRSMGNAKVSMFTSIIMNLINVVGNAILIYGCHMGVEGVAIPTVLSRLVAAVILLGLIRQVKNPIHIDRRFRLGFDWFMIKRILRIGVPNAFENSMFQFGKIIVQHLISSFGTVAIAANAVANTVAGIEVIPGSAIGLALITIVGQCVGANDYKQAKIYTKKLMKMAYILMGILNVFILVFSNHIIHIYHLSPQTTQLALTLLTYHSICCVFIWPASFTLPNALRAANDVKYTMVVSILSMWVCRIALSYFLASYLEFGVLGVWIAMSLDWGVRSAFFITRYLRGKWMTLNCF